MSLEQQIILFQVLMPTVLVAIGGALIVWAAEGDDWEPPYFTSTFVKLFLGCLICGIGVLASDLARRGVLTTPKEWLSQSFRYRWEWMVLTLPGAWLFLALVRSIVTRPSSFSKMIWPICVAISIGFHFWSLSDLVKNNEWMNVLASLCIGVIVTMINIASVDDLVTGGRARWAALAVAAQLGCVATIAVQGYMSLVQWSLLGAAIALGVTLVSLFFTSRAESIGGWNLSIIVFPLMSTVSPTLFAAQNFATDKLPHWLLGLVLMLPTIVWLFDFIYTRTSHAWIRVFWAFLICMSVLITIIILTKPFVSEW